jgi:hypothetical protein
MKRVLLIAVLFFWAFAGYAQPGDPIKSSVTLSSFTHPQYGYTILFPSDWDSSSVTRFSFVAKEMKANNKDNFSANMNVNVVNMAPEIGLNEVADATIKVVRTKFAATKASKKTITAKSGLKGILVRMEMPVTASTVIVTFTAIYHIGSKAYAVSCGCSITDEEKYLSIFQVILEGFGSPRS